MKSTLLILFAIILLSSCHKETSVKPVNETEAFSPNVTIPAADTLADGAGFKVRLWTSATSYDETTFIFKKAANINYAADEDALYSPGSGALSLASISKDQKKLAINTLPFRNGLKPQLDIESKTATTASLGIRSLNKMPSNLRVMLRDKYLRDSVNLSAGNYSFKITADSNSYGSNRFQIVFRLDIKH